MGGILEVATRLTSDLDALSAQHYDYKTRDHTAEDIKLSWTILYLLDRPNFPYTTRGQRSWGQGYRGRFCLYSVHPRKLFLTPSGLRNYLTRGVLSG